MPNPPLTALTAPIVISSQAWQQIYLTPSASDDPYVLAERTSHLIRDVVLAIAHEPLADRIHLEHRPYDPDRPDGSAQVICLRIARTERMSEPGSLLVSLPNEPIVQLGD